MSHRTFRSTFAAIALAIAVQGCAAGQFLRYKINPKYPEFKADETLTLPGLRATIGVEQRQDDGMYRIVAENELDLTFAIGYLQARDRFFQMDLLRHSARGELAELIGNQVVKGKSVLDGDRFARFVGYKREAEKTVVALSPADRALLDAYTAGVNAWINNGRKSLEHRLLDAEIKPWRPEDSIAVQRLVMFGLTHNYSREVRRLLLACAAGIDGMERMWPNHIEFGPYILPPEALHAKTYPVPPGVVPEMAAKLNELCPKQSVADGKLVDTTTNFAVSSWVDTTWQLLYGQSASNNWVVSGDKSASGGVMLANDPHLPHMNPPILWGFNSKLGELEVAGFTVPGLPLPIFGTNRDVAWGATVNNVDLQDVYLEYPADNSDNVMAATSYFYEGQAEAFEVRSETFGVKGEADRVLTARFSRHGLLLNDVDPTLAKHAPLLTLKLTEADGTGDVQAARNLLLSRTVADAVAAIQPMETACFNWLLGGRDGHNAWTSPCRVPKREGWLGTFPAPGWLKKYEWNGYYAKAALPQAVDPARGWQASANNAALPFNRFPTPYVNDGAPANRFIVLARELEAVTGATAEWMTHLHLNVEQEYWPRVRQQIGAAFCESGIGESRLLRDARLALCNWDGHWASESTGATVFALLTFALLDQALADELPAGADDPIWPYILDIYHMEANVDWLWQKPVDGAVWDNIKTAEKENKIDILELALAQAVVEATRRYGGNVKLWRWGDVRPFVLKHPFGAVSPAVAGLFNSPPLPGIGGPETVYKNQYPRSDRDDMHPAAGPAIRVIYDFGGNGQFWYNLAGGQSGWPKSPYYANQLEDWRYGRIKPLFIGPNDPVTRIQLAPAGDDKY